MSVIKIISREETYGYEIVKKPSALEFEDVAYDQVVLHHPLFNVTVLAVFFLIFSIIGTIMFTKSERNR